LRRDDAANGVATRQDDAAVIHLGLGLLGVGGQLGAFDQCASAGGAPVGLGVRCKHGVAVAADAFHRASVADVTCGCGTSGVRGNAGEGRRYTGCMHPPIRLVAIDMDGTLLPSFSQTISPRNGKALKDLQDAGVTVAIATGRRTAYTAPLLADLDLRADMPLITSNGAVTRTLGGDPIDRSAMRASVARGVCGLLRPYGVVVFTRDRVGRGEMVLESLEQAHERIALWVEANRDAFEVVRPLEKALADGDDPIQGMVAGGVDEMRKAEAVLKASEWAGGCACVRTEYPARDLSILDLVPPGVSKGWALERLAKRLGVDRKETMAIGDNWNDVDMLEWAAQGVLMGNAARELRGVAKLRGWKQAPRNDEDGVAVVLEKVLAQQVSARA